MKKPAFLILMVLSYLFSGCRKDEPIPEPEPEQPEVEVTNSLIRVGNHEDIIARTYDSTLNWIYHSTVHYDFDLDQDGTSDIRIFIHVTGSPNIGIIPTTWMECLHADIGLAGFYETFTTYKTQTYSIITNQDGNPEIVNYVIYSCLKIDSSYAIHSENPNVYQINPMNFGDILDHKRDFKADSVNLIKGGLVIPKRYIGQRNDTLLSQVIFHNSNCNQFQEGELKYIGFKLQKGNTGKLGWIKLFFKNPRELTIVETAIQK